MTTEKAGGYVQMGMMVIGLTLVAVSLYQLLFLPPPVTIIVRPPQAPVVQTGSLDGCSNMLHFNHSAITSVFVCDEDPVALTTPVPVSPEAFTPRQFDKAQEIAQKDMPEPIPGQVMLDMNAIIDAARRSPDGPTPRSGCIWVEDPQHWQFCWNAEHFK